MNEEIRKEFEEWADSIGLCQVDLIIDLERYMDGNVELAWQAWKASRENLPKIKLPGVNFSSTFYGDIENRVINKCKQAIHEAGYEVAE